MPGFRNALFLIWLGLILAGCPERPSPYLLRDTVPEDQFTFIDTLKEKAIRSYSTDPELSEKFLNQAIRACDSIHLPQKKFQLLLEKAEFYQYRKPDFLESVRNLSAAVRIFVQHPGPYAEDPYIYINIGNFFYRLRHYDKANSFYRLADAMAMKIGLPHARAIALQNIGLSWMEMNRDDSAFRYYHLSKDFTPEIGYLTRAQSFLYLSDLSFKENEKEKVVVHADSSFRMILWFNNQNPESLGAVYPKLLITSQELKCKLHKLLFNYFQSINQPDSAAVHYAKALSIASNVRSYGILAGLYHEAILHDESIGKNRNPEVIADSVFQMASMIRDPFILKVYTDTLASFFNTTGNSQQYRKYAMLSEMMEDSIQRLLGSDELFENQILISSAAAEQVIQKMNFERTGHQREILFFRVIFVIILLATILIVTAMIVMIRQKRSLMAAYKNLALRIRQSLHAEREPTPEIIIQVSDKKSGIILKLQEIITSQKIYLNKDLTLTELSAILQTNKSYLSEVINTKFGMNFNDYMNQLRIKEACRLMLEPGFAKSSLDQIADKCGFNSKSTFYVAFKKSTGMSPAAFSKTLSDKKPAEPMNYIALASTGDQPVKVAIKKGDFSVADPDTSKNPPEI